MGGWKYAVSFAERAPDTAPLPLRGDLYENMGLAASLGFDGLEFHTREDFVFDYGKAASSGGRISMLVTGRLSTEGGHTLLDEDPASVEACMNALKTYLDKAARLGAGIVLGWAKGTAAPGGGREEALRLLGGRLRELDAYSKKVGAPIMIEVINRYETNLLNTAAEMMDFLEMHQLDNCYVHLDTFHMNIEEQSPYEAIRLCGDRLGYFHVADNTRRYPGSGQLDFGKILAALDGIGYTGWIDVECLPSPDGKTAAREALAHLKKCGNQKPA